MGIVLRRATETDLDFLVELLTAEDVEPFLGARSERGRDGLRAELERQDAEPDAFGRFVIEVDGEAAGICGFHRVNERNRIAHLEKFAVHSRFRGRGVGDEAARALQRHLLIDLGYHRLELEIYGFNERAIAHAERSGYVREGVRRQAYERHGEWQDGVLFGLVREDLDA
ncbi:MAG: GNAT family protein [Gemmatimonadota bacterium]